MLQSGRISLAAHVYWVEQNFANGKEAKKLVFRKTASV